MEKEGTPNAGFWDQHAVFEWVQKYISLVNGDKENVSAWGESAGAGSIYHHLVFEGGTKDPLFKRAVMQSPAWSSSQDRAGTLEATYKSFEKAAACAGKGLKCLRGQPAETLLAASDKLNSGHRQGTFGFGPAPDGKLIRQVAQLEMAAGNNWKGIESIVSSHVLDEASMFTDPNVDSDAAFDAYLRESFSLPAVTESKDVNKAKLKLASDLVDQIEKMYPPIDSREGKNLYTSEHDRMSAFVRDSSFTCNNRHIAQAYVGKVWSMQYSYPPATHGSDVIATYFDPDAASIGSQGGDAGKTWKLAYQAYLTSHARTGNPNELRNREHSIEWPLTDPSGEEIKGVLNVVGGDGPEAFAIIQDTLNVKSKCDFWHDVTIQSKKLIE
jgi:carboxylesterase type B